jgi:uncharacterized protein
MMTQAHAPLERKRAEALKRLRECDSVLIALSGGVDSAVLLQLAVEALGPDRVLAVTGRSASLAAHELEDARRVAGHLGVRHESVETREVANPAYRANRGDRCYHCRTELFRELTGLASSRGLRSVAYGAIADDLSDFRPGMRAARELGVVAPLLEAGIDKREVRDLATAGRLPVRDKPAAACLSSRIPTGTEVTERRLAQVEAAESALRQLGFGQLRVRHHGEVARLELDAAGLARLADPELSADVVDRVRRAGFRYVAVDLEGYRSGSLNAPPPTSS